MTAKRAICLLLVTFLAGCASPAPVTAPSPSAISRPPSEPTDRIRDTAGWVVGTVTAGGSGPCYGLVTDDGKQYALHSAAGTTLTKGARMRVRTEPAKARISCGAGKSVEMLTAEPLR
jgi:hypothetical protein